MLDKVLFYFFGGLAVLSAILVVTRRNAVHSAIFLATTLLATAGIYLQLRAEFLFAVQVILYVGGIVVLFVFVIMLVNLEVALHQVQFTGQKWVASLVALALGGEILFAIYLAQKSPPNVNVLRLPAAPVTALDRNTEVIGRALFTGYMLPFEIASVLLLVAMIGAVVMAKRKV